MVGSTSHDLLDAIFEVELSDEMLDELDQSVDEEEPTSPPAGRIKFNYGASGPRSPSGTRTPRGRYTSTASMPNSPGFSQRSRSRNGGLLAPPDASSPLAQLFTNGIRGGGGQVSPLIQEDMVHSLKRLEGLLEGLPEMQKVRGELRDTKERLERIETLLLTLTRSARE